MTTMIETSRISRYMKRLEGMTTSELEAETIQQRWGRLYDGDGAYDEFLGACSLQWALRGDGCRYSRLDTARLYVSIGRTPVALAAAHGIRCAGVRVVAGIGEADIWYGVEVDDEVRRRLNLRAM